MLKTLSTNTSHTLRDVQMSKNESSSILTKKYDKSMRSKPSHVARRIDYNNYITDSDDEENVSIKLYFIS